MCCIHCVCLGLCYVLARLPNDRVTSCFDALCWLHVEQLDQMVSSQHEFAYAPLTVRFSNKSCNMLCNMLTCQDVAQLVLRLVVLQVSNELK